MKLKVLWLAALISGALSACDTGEEQQARGTVVPTASRGQGEVMVFAASSLTEAFSDLGATFQTENPGIRITFNFGGTPTLRTQLEHGARADILASADEEQMGMALKSGVLAGPASPFASNYLVVIAPVRSTSVTDLSDLAKPGVKLVLALNNVPVGRYARRSLRTMGSSGAFPLGFAERALANVVSEETNVRQVFAKVALGEADAAIVYSTDADVRIDARVRVVRIPDEYNVTAIYPIGIVEGAPNAQGAALFVEFVLAAEGQSILAGHGFGPVP